MTLPVTGAINFSQIGTEVGQSLLTSVNLNDIDMRRLVNKLTDKSQISANDFHGKQFGVGPGYALPDFTSVTGAIPNTVITSNTIYATVDSSVAIFCDTAAQYSINGGAWTDKSVLGAITAGQTISVRCTSATTYSTASDVTANLGGVIKVFSVSTGANSLITIGLITAHYVNWSIDAYGRRNSATSAGISINIGNAPGTYNFGTLSSTVWGIDNLAKGTYTYSLYRDSFANSGYVTLSCMDTDPLPNIPSNGITVTTNPGNSMLAGSLYIQGVKYNVRIGGTAYAGGSSMIANTSCGINLELA